MVETVGVVGVWAWATATAAHNRQNAAAAIAMRKCRRPGAPGLPVRLRPGADARGPPARSGVTARNTGYTPSLAQSARPADIGGRSSALTGLMFPPRETGAVPAHAFIDASEAGARAARPKSLDGDETWASGWQGRGGAPVKAGLGSVKVGGGGGLNPGCAAAAQRLTTVNRNGSPTLPAGSTDP